MRTLFAFLYFLSSLANLKASILKMLNKRQLKLAVRLIIGIALLAYVLRSAEIDELHLALSKISIWVIVGVVAGYSATLIISALRWYTIVVRAGIPTSIPNIIGLQFLGQYLNCFGFGTIGGDVAKGIMLAGGEARKDVAVASVVVDRLVGMVILALIGLLASFIVHVGNLPPSFQAIALGFIICSVVGWFFVHPIVVIVEKYIPKLGTWLHQLLSALPRNPRDIFIVSAFALLFHLLQIFLFQWMASCIGAPIPLEYILVTLPFANLISTLPVSWMGLGVRENLYVLFFVPRFMNHQQAILCGVVWLGAMTLAGALGGAVSFLSRSFKNSQLKS